jgi:hypothetical protein
MKIKKASDCSASTSITRATARKSIPRVRELVDTPPKPPEPPRLLNRPEANLSILVRLLAPRRMNLALLPPKPPKRALPSTLAKMIARRHGG